MFLESEALQKTIADLKKALEQRDVALGQKTGAIAKLEAEAQTRRRMLEELSAANARLQTACEERLTLIDSQHKTIGELQLDLQASGAFPGLVKLRKENQDNVDEQAASNARLQRICDERGALLESQAQSIAMLTQECAQRDEEIARLHATALERLSVIEALNDALERLPR